MIPRSCIIAAVLVAAGPANAQTATQPVTITSADQALASDLANGAIWTTQPTTLLAGTMTVLTTNSNGNGNSRCNNNGNGNGRQCPASP